MFQLGHKLSQCKWMKMTEESYGKHTILHNVKASYQVITLHGSLDWHRTYEDEGVKWMKRWKDYKLLQFHVSASLSYNGAKKDINCYDISS